MATETLETTETAVETTKATKPAPKAASLKNYGGVSIGEIYAVPLELINATYNHRVVFPRLKDMGHKYIDLIHMALGDQKDEFVRLVDEHESVPVKEGEMTIPALAANIRKLNQQIQSINVQQLGTTNHKDADGKVIGKKYGYGIISGSHRTAALAYAYAKWGYVLPNSKGFKKPFVRATQERVTKEEVGKKSMAENMLRRDPSEYEVGEWVTSILAEGGSLDEIVQEYGRSASYYKNCMAIYQPTVDGVDGKAVMDKLKRKEITKAEAIATVTGKAPAPSRTPKALKTKGKGAPAAKTGDAADNSRSGPNRKTLSVASIEKLIDESPHDGKPASVARIKAFAEVLGSEYDKEMKASEQRLKKAGSKTA